MASFFHNVSAAWIPKSTAQPSLYSSVNIPSVLSFATSNSATWLYTTLAIVLALLALEQSVYRYKKGILPGAKWTIPIIGKFADSVSPSMQAYKKQWDSGDLSAISVFNIFIVMASSNEFARKIMNSPQYASPALVHAAKQILSPKNWVFLTGKNHVDYRRGLNTLFTRKALGIYIGIQDSVIRKHLNNWLQESTADPSPRPIMMGARYLNMDTSLTVFAGSHIPEHAGKEVNDKYWAITQSLELVNFPFAFPGTKIYKAIQARKAAMRWLELAAHNSKEAMANGGEPECMLDAWVKNLADPAYKGRRDFSDNEMAMVLFSFLFASQDAMSSGLIWGFQHLADHPDVLAKVRAEQAEVRKGDYEKPMTLEMLEEMPYLKAYVKESLRLMPPVLMVPYATSKAFPITDNYTVPAGSMVIPSFYNSLHDPEVYPEPDFLRPDRWLNPESLANANPKSYMVWGSGPHKCIGHEYATLTMALTLAIASMMFDFDHEITPLSQEIDIIATVFPKDGCRLKLTPRK